MKKTMVAAILATGIIFISQISIACPGGPKGRKGMGFNNCNKGNVQAACQDETMIKAREKFLAETTELRKQTAVKMAEIQALMASQTPDEKKISALTGELFDVKNQLRIKATELGLKKCFKGPGMMGMGPGMMGMGCDKGMRGPGNRGNKGKGRRCNM
jgi:zinc resistance-associated protein